MSEPNEMTSVSRDLRLLFYPSAVLVCLGTLTLIGCASDHGILGVDRCADIPRGAIPEPAGSKVCEWQTAQVTSALADQGVFHLSDFRGDTAALSPAAIERLARSVDGGLAIGLTWIVEPSGDLELDAERVASLAAALHSAGLAVSADAIQVAYPAALGLPGPRAERIGIGGSRTSSNRGNGSRAVGGVGTRGSGSF